MTVDIRSLILAHGISFVLGTFLFGFVWRQNRNRAPCVNSWMMFHILLACGFLGLFLNSSAQIPWFIVLANTTLVAALAFLSAGFRTLCSLPHRNKLYAAAVLTKASIHSYFIFITPNFSIRVINTSAFFVLFCIEIIRLILQHRATRASLPLKLVVGALALLAVPSFVRGFYHAFWPQGTSLFSASHVDSIAFLVTIIVSSSMLFLLTLVINERLHERLKQESDSALQEKEFTNDILANLVETLLIFDENNSLVRTSTGTNKAFGFGQAQLFALNFKAGVTSDKDFFTHVSAARAGERIRTEGWIENHIGERVPVFFTMAPLKLPNREHTHAVVNAHDISDIKKAENEKREVEAQLAQAAKLASLGTLGAGVAHELNNPLAAVKGFAEILAADASTEDSKKMANKIVLAANRMQKITDHLRSFAADTSKRPMELVSLANIVQDSFILFERRFVLNSIDFEVDFPETLPRVLSDRNLLESVFQNLLSNSADAFQSHPEIQERRIRVKASYDPSEHRIDIEFFDNAGGIPKQIQNQIFDPFFTTKPVGKGTGLGLSICNSAMEKHGGKILLAQSQPGTSLFKIQLPAGEILGDSKPMRVQNEPFPAQLAQAQHCANQRHRILIIDDEPMVIELLTMFLRKSCEVVSTTNPHDGIELAQSESFSLVLTDMRMPNVSGLDVIRAIKVAKPNQLIAIMSGHAKTELDIEEACSLGACQVFSKPLPSKEEFLMAIHNIVSKISPIP